jgi:hypothetical protein
MHFDVQHELSVCGRCLIRDVRTVIPASLTAASLDIAHEGHPGIVRMKQRCRETVWWPGIDIAIERYVRDCESCILSGKSAKPRQGPLQPIPPPSGPWRKLSLDIAGEFVAAPNHQRYVIVATDVYSKGSFRLRTTSLWGSSATPYDVVHVNCMLMPRSAFETLYCNEY